MGDDSDDGSRRYWVGLYGVFERRDENPEVIERLTGIAPTELWLKGDAIRSARGDITEATRPSSGWRLHLDSQLVPGSQSLSELHRLISMLTTRREEIKLLYERGVSFHLVLCMFDGGLFSDSLDVEELASLADLKIPFGFYTAFRTSD